MFLREKLYLVASAVDDSIKASTAVYDVTIFKTFVDFEDYVNKYPVAIDTLVITSDDLQFTSTNMQRLFNILLSPFVRIKSKLIYLIDSTYEYKVVSEFFREKLNTSWAVYQGTLDQKFIAEVLSGEKRDTIEGQVDIITYRMRSEDYVKQEALRQEETDNEDYVTDEDELSGIPDEELPVEILPDEAQDARTVYVAGTTCAERTLLTYLIAQYLALQGKVLLMEKDWQYHRLGDMVTKSGVPCLQVDVQDIRKDLSAVIKRIKEAHEKLIVVTCYDKFFYDYNFLMDIFESTLKADLVYIIRECNLEEVPVGEQYTIVTRNTVPDILEMCEALRHEIDPDRVKFVGVSIGDLGAVAVSSSEMSEIISTVIERDGVQAAVVRADGVKLAGGGKYDIFSIIASGNRRQA